jgi:hypothetical protein
MAIFDNVVHESSNFKGYTGNAPTNEAEYDALDCWKDKSQAPSWASVSSDMELEEVRVNRRKEYNALNQLELISDDAINGTTTHKDAITAIKDKYPKPE